MDSIERMARAHDPELWARADQAMEGLESWFKETALARMRAALAEVQEPTLAMVKAAGRADAAAVWRAMLAALLDESKLTRLLKPERIIVC